MEKFTKLGSSVEQIFEDVRGYWKSSVIISSIELDIFTNIDKGITCNDLANKLQLHYEALERLLDSLVNLNLLQKEENIYYNTYNAQKYLVKKNNPSYIGYVALYHKSRYNVWENLGKSIKTGQPIASASFLAPDKNQINNYARAMSARAKLEVSDVLERIDFSNCQRILDLGGAPGTFAFAFAEKYPNLDIVVFDLPDMMEISKEITNKKHNIHLVEGNFDIDSLGYDYCAVFMSQILDSLGRKGVEDLFTKVFNSLKMGGKLIIRDYILRDDNTEPEVSIFRSLNVLLTTATGKLYNTSDYFAMLSQAGFKNITFMQLPGPTDLIQASK
jgi:hypothetical protein